MVSIVVVVIGISRRVSGLQQMRDDEYRSRYLKYSKIPPNGPRGLGLIRERERERERELSTRLWRLVDHANSYVINCPEGLM